MRRIEWQIESDGYAAIVLLGLVALAFLGVSALASSPAASPVHRTVLPEPAPVPASGEGGLILRSVDGDVVTSVPAMRLGTDIVAKVSGQTARVTVTQAFRNTSDEWMEATYLYPLPDNGAVDTLQMVVGDRIFTGRIKPREEAREIYEEAKTNGQKAGLVEQHRPNMFRNSIANVGPGETVLVQIELQAPIQQVAGEYSLRMPLVVGPRYVAGTANADGGLSRAALLAGSAEILAPTADPEMVARAGGGLNPVSITVELDPGFTADAITSPYHEVDIAGSGRTRTVTLAEGAVPANRDFELRWQASGAVPSLGLFRQRHDGEDYVMATITPPAARRIGEAPMREMVFVIDNSGSMAGESMEAAKTSLLHALGTLRAQDRFNIIRFDDTMSELFDNAVPASPANIRAARAYTQGLDADGGTEMLPALRAALADPAYNDGEDSAVAAAAFEVSVEMGQEARLRQIIFLTDGALSNEADMMREISQNRGRSRVFMVGMGSAPNTFLMRRMAEAGRGTFTHVGMGEEAEAQMQRLLDRLARPVATSLVAYVDGGEIEFAPSDLPDLYAGEPLVLLGRGDSASGTLTVRGWIGEERWTRTVDLSKARPSEAIAKLWARRRIAEVEAQRWSGEIGYDEADEAVEALGMAYHLVTSRTSLIALDETPSRPDGATLTREELPLLLPAGWDFDHLFAAQFARADRSGPLHSEKQRERLELPNTATGWMLGFWLGLAVMLTGFGGFAWFRWERDGKRSLARMCLRPLQRQAA